MGVCLYIDSIPYNGGRGMRSSPAVTGAALSLPALVFLVRQELGHFRAADLAGAFRGPTAILQLLLLRVLHRTLSFTFYAVPLNVCHCRTSLCKTLVLLSCTKRRAMGGR